jgi:hypothetical protein
MLVLLLVPLLKVVDEEVVGEEGVEMPRMGLSATRHSPASRTYTRQT